MSNAREKKFDTKTPDDGHAIGSLIDLMKQISLGSGVSSDDYFNNLDNAKEPPPLPKKPLIKKNKSLSTSSPYPKFPTEQKKTESNQPTSNNEMDVEKKKKIATETSMFTPSKNEVVTTKRQSITQSPSVFFGLPTGTNKDPSDLPLFTFENPFRQKPKTPADVNKTGEKTNLNSLSQTKNSDPMSF